jgi:hypothetical protein
MTDIPKRPMDADLARYTVERLLNRMVEWSAYAAEPVTRLDHARDKLVAVAEVMRQTTGDVIDKWDEYMISGHPTWTYDGENGGFCLWVRLIEDDIRHERKRKRDAV